MNMPPSAKITKDMIVDAAFEVAREKGAEHINARTVAQKLNCSTQPVMYHFSKIEQIKKAVYEKADLFHAAYITNIPENSSNPMKEIGLSYIRFAATEKYLFRFLFQSNGFSEKNLQALIDAEELKPFLTVLQSVTGTGVEQAKEIFLSLFLFVHGYASMFANNTLEYDEEVIAAHLYRAYVGAVYAFKEELK